MVLDHTVSMQKFLFCYLTVYDCRTVEAILKKKIIPKKLEKLLVCYVGRGKITKIICLATFCS